MIRIDHISFEFAAPDEAFAHKLYADWDGFCRRCFEQVVEECYAFYDKDKVLHEIERLDLDLGGIPEEYFYREFPRRLKEELLKALPAWKVRTEEDEEKNYTSRQDNLLFFLEHGYPNPEWADCDFNPVKEMEWLLSQSVARHALFIKRMVFLCLNKEYVLRRLLWQTDNIAIHLKVYAAALTEPTAGLQEKRRFLALVLEEKSDISLYFIHEAGSDEELHDMASLLDSPSVRQIMQTEMKEHAELDLPPYWHYLYEWLVRYYPFNGLAIFGDKEEFIRHLHHKLLTFIRKRNESPYLSKTELTAGFLLEVFGPAYYIDVLNAIYSLQPHHADGSPVYDGYFNRELYRVFIQLSLLRLPGIEEKKDAGEQTNLKLTTAERAYNMETVLALSETTENDGTCTAQSVFEEWQRRRISDSTVVRTLLKERWNTVEGFTTWLADTSVPTERRRRLMQTAITENVQKWTALLRKLPKEGNTLDTIAKEIPASIWLQGIAKASFYQASVLSRITDRIERQASGFPFLIAGSISLASALSKAMLLYMQDTETLERTLTEKEIMEKFLGLLCLIYTGKADCYNETGWRKLSNQIVMDIGNNEVNRQEQETAEKLSNSGMDDILFRHTVESLLRNRPEELLLYICNSVSQGMLSVNQWAEWLEADDWRYLATSLSLSMAEQLRQISDILGLDNRMRRLAWGLYIVTKYKKEEWRYNSSEDNIRPFVQVVFSLQGKSDAGIEEIVQKIKIEMNINEETIMEMKEVPEVMLISNAGLCLLAPWFVRLFSMLGYLDEEKKKFKDTASKVRAVFLLQYVTYGEEQEYREPELAFNRLLTALPLHVPLPKRLALDDTERQVADSMMAGVKANWSQMGGTSIKGFRLSFIARNGTLEQQEERWLLAVENKTHDILLESIPWSFKQIRLPWLKKHVQVAWREKQVFE
ncbi:contractile injection system tape measure protein [uncultured Parabacteroides sp.]|uniref:contractile injection system tape measure protein n=1 Tax=uncultured Parabacteroides sp. TaxID=512312 RepID=UPI0025E3E5DA|nr:contractile injection system tape measure protein [uncultured Parabacteroides sp.]